MKGIKKEEGKYEEKENAEKRNCIYRNEICIGKKVK